LNNNPIESLVGERDISGIIVFLGTGTTYHWRYNKKWVCCRICVSCCSDDRRFSYIYN